MSQWHKTKTWIALNLLELRNVTFHLTFKHLPLFLMYFQEKSKATKIQSHEVFTHQDVVTTIIEAHSEIEG